MGNKALLIGINAYQSSPLSGCLNDISDMANCLVDRYKFKSDEVRLLADSRATTSAIWERLNWLVDAGPGDTIFLHYSGHGTQVPSRDPISAEPDKLDEVIVPYDFDWTPSKMITDTEFYNFFGKKVKQGVKLYFVADCCHSGTLSRSFNKGPEIKPKYYPAPIDIAWRARSSKITKSDGFAPKKSRAYIGVALDIGLVPACLNTQTAADTYINGRPCGALTNYFLKSLTSMSLNTPLLKVVEQAKNNLARDGYQQRPVAEGARKNKPFLS